MYKNIVMNKEHSLSLEYHVYYEKSLKLQLKFVRSPYGDRQTREWQFQFLPLLRPRTSLPNTRQLQVHPFLTINLVFKPSA